MWSLFVQMWSLFVPPCPPKVDFLPGIFKDKGYYNSFREILRKHLQHVHGMDERAPSLDELQRQLSLTLLVPRQLAVSQVVLGSFRKFYGCVGSSRKF